MKATNMTSIGVTAFLRIISIRNHSFRLLFPRLYNFFDTVIKKFYSEMIKCSQDDCCQLLLILPGHQRVLHRPLGVVNHQDLVTHGLQQPHIERGHPGHLASKQTILETGRD